MANDPVNHPAHYTSHPSGVECIQITEHMGFNLGNALKYIWRADLKGDALEDLRKAAWYVQREIARREHAERKRSRFDVVDVQVADAHHIVDPVERKQPVLWISCRDVPWCSLIACTHAAPGCASWACRVVSQHNAMPRR